MGCQHAPHSTKPLAPIQSSPYSLRPNTIAPRGMPPSSSQAFLKELDKKLWTAADKLRANLDAAVYKHAVLGLIFLKYVSDSFAQRQAEIEAMLRDPKSDYFLDPADYGGEDSAEYREAIHAE